MNTTINAYKERMVGSEFVVLTLAAIMAFFCFSLLIYAIPVALPSIGIRTAVIDCGFVLLCGLTWQYLNCKASRLLSQAILFCIVLGIGFFGFTAFLIGLFAGEHDNIFVAKDFRIFIYFFVTLIVWSSIPFSERPVLAIRQGRLITVLFTFSLLGTLTYIIIGNNMFGDEYGVSGRQTLMSSQPDEIKESFSRVVIGKYQSTPFVLAFVQCIGLIFYLEAKHLRYLIYSFSLLTLSASIALLSNMRAIIISWVIGSLVALFFTFIRRSNSLNPVVLLKAIVPMVIGILCLPTIFNYLDSTWTGFSDQILEKGIYSNSESFRTDALLDVLSAESLETFGLFGLGMGGHFFIDSAFQNIAGQFGYIFLILYLTLIGISLIAGWKMCFSELSANRGLRFSSVPISIFSGILALALNNYNHSHFLFIPDAVFAGLLIGHSLSSVAPQKRQFSGAY